MIKYTELKSTNRHNLMDVLPLAKPFTVLIEPSSLCNFRCIQCFQSIEIENYFSRNRMHMPLARFRRIIEQLKAWPGPKIKVLKLSLYGEPLLNSDFCTMLKLAKDAAVAERIETTTNASLLTRAISQQLVQNQLDYLRVSIYAADQKTHQERTGSTVSIATIHENLRVLQEEKKRAASKKPFVGVKMLDSFSEENDQFIQMYRDIADELYFDKPHGWIQLDGVDFTGNYYKDNVEVARKELDINSTNRIACPMPFTTMTIRSNGAVSPCCVDFIGGTNLGNVDEKNLPELWQSDAWFEFQKMQLQGRKHENYSCARCDIYRSKHYTIDTIDGFPVENLRAKY